MRQYVKKLMTKQCCIRRVIQRYFQRIGKGTDFSARRIIQKRASDAGDAVVDMQIVGRWKRSQMPAHYAKSELPKRGAIAKYKEKQKSL